MLTLKTAEVGTFVADMRYAVGESASTKLWNLANERP